MSMSLRRKLFIAIALFVLTPFFLTGVLSFQEIKREMVSSTEAGLVSVASVMKDRVEEFSRHHLEILSFLCGLGLLQDAAHDLEAGAERGRRPLREALSAYAQNDHDMEAVFLMHPLTGEVMVSSNPSMEGMFFNQRPYYRLGKEGPVIYRVHYAHSLERNVVAVAAPMKRDGRLVGVLAAWVRLDSIHGIIKSAGSWHCYLVTRANLSVVGEGPEAASFRSGIFTHGVEEALAGKTGSGVYTGPEGAIVVGAYAPIQSLDIALLVEMPMEMVLAKANQEGLKVLLIMSAMAALVLLLSLAVSTRLSQPIADLASRMRTIGWGSVSEGGPIVASGSAEVEDLSKSFNRMVERRRAAEAAMLESNLKFRSLAENSADCMARFESNLRLLYANAAFERLTGNPPYAMVGRTPSEMGLPEDFGEELMARSQRVFEAGGPERWEDEFAGPEGPRSMDWSLVAEASAAGAVESVLLVGRDITERIRSEQELRRSLREKDVLLKEVHHRVKNNMQLITSLVRLQSADVRDDADRAMFRETQDRIRALSFVYEKLYRADDFTAVDLGAYLRGIATSLFRTYSVSAGQVTLSVDVADVALGIEAAVPCGLLLNELMCNSIKHAFPDGRSGVMEVSLRASGGGFELVFKDDGAGFAPGALPVDASGRPELEKAGSIGLQIIDSLVRQLRGRLEIDTAPGAGTKYTILFSEPSYKQRF